MMLSRGPSLCLLATLLSFAVVGCEAESRASSAGVKHVERVSARPEAVASSVILSAEAEGHLQLSFGSVEAHDFPRSRSVGGEVIAPPGETLTLVAPFAGIVRVPEGVRVGSAVTRGSALCSIEPILGADTLANVSISRQEAAGVLAALAIEKEMAAAEATRAEKMRANGIGSERSLEEARSRREVSQANHAAAEARIAALDRLLAARPSETAPANGDLSTAIASPLEGVVIARSVLDGQRVPAGAPLLVVSPTDRLWVRVPLSKRLLIERAAESPVFVRSLGANLANPGSAARERAGPPTSPGATGAVDRYFELAAGAEPFFLGERVEVTVTLRTEESRLSVPHAAIVRTVDGTAWVYEARGDGKYTRRIVDVASVRDSLAVLRRGPPAGTKVVTGGAAELFGSEFFVSH